MAATSTPARARTPAARKRKTPAAPKPYHHGALPEALLAAAETVLRRDGIAGLGLRAIAREAGVSHTAPQHHFGDTTGLLSELAAVGYRRLGGALAASGIGLDTERARRTALGRAYVRFAYENPALFGLMFRNEMIDMKRAGLQEATARAMGTMAVLLPDGGAGWSPEAGLSREQALRLTAAWSLVHGLATLLIDQRLRGILKRTTAFDDALELAEAVTEMTRLEN
jgi:AcrR family transcriptional regulator